MMSNRTWFIFLVFTTALVGNYEHDCIAFLQTNGVSPALITQLKKQVQPHTQRQVFKPNSLPLFQQYPKLKQSVSYVPLGRFPTPIRKIKLGHSQLYIKLDGLSGGTLFGGNKVRKLEFILADALAQGAPGVITFGGSGSNHAAATATHAKKLGLKCNVSLSEQANSNVLRRNLLIMHDNKADMHEFPSLAAAYTKTAQDAIKNSIPYCIPLGGSNALGTLGIVSAAFELKQQIDAGLIHRPDYIYLPFGSMGTTAGLALGLKAAGLTTQIIAVKVGAKPTYKKLEKLFNETNEFLNKHDPSFPIFKMDNVTVRTEFFGGTYGKYTKPGADAVAQLKHENIELDGTYTGKAFAALLEDMKDNKLKDKTVLFWNTFSEQRCPDCKYTSLKPCFHKYFEQEAQDLDSNLVRVGDIDPTIVEELWYATPNNIAYCALYPPKANAHLQPEVAQALAHAQQELKKLGLGLKIWDAYRPFSIQQKLYKTNPKIVCNPSRGVCAHCRGVAVDATLIDLKTGKEIAMPTGFDDTTKKARSDYMDLPKHVLKNRTFFHDIMKKYEFYNLVDEWWHFNHKDIRKYPVLDVSFEALKKAPH